MSDWDPKWGPPPPPPDPSTKALEDVRAAKRERPAFVNILTIAMIVSGLVSLYLSAERSSAITACWLVLEGPLLYFLWAGRNWARMLAIALSVLSLVGFGVLALPPSLASQIAWPLRIKVLVDAMLGVVTIVGLNTRSVREFFVESSVKAR